MRNLQQWLFDGYTTEVRRVAGNDDGIITALQGDIETPTDGSPFYHTRFEDIHAGPLDCRAKWDE